MTVNNVNALFTYAKGQTDAAPARADETAQGSFGQVMAKVNGRPEGVQPETPGTGSAAGQNVVSVTMVKKESAPAKVQQPETEDAGGDQARVNREADGNVSGDTGTEAKEGAEEAAAEKLEQAGEELIREIADEMDVTPEEVEAAMTLLGLTAVQLFDTDNLRQLLLTISDNPDEMALLTDESLYGSLQDLLGVVEESLESLQKELGMSEQELDALLKQLQEEPAVPEEEPVPEVNLEGMKDYTVSVQKDGETVRMKVTVDDASGNRSVQESAEAPAKTQVQGNPRMRQDTSADSGKEGSPAGQGQAMMQMPKLPEQVSELPEAAPVEYRSVQPEEIMNQIVEYMKISLKPETQTMELQLHPASLGTVNVQIMAKEGGLTAHFTTQNEAVRAVIETQLIQLKNQFEEQGIKVDAVEVTVANHAYGQQFSQDSENAKQEQGKAGRGRRQINLDQIESEEDLEEMEDSERIAVEMMQASGGTVDYTA